MANESTPKRLSGCAMRVSLGILGDRWSQPIIRDLTVRGYHLLPEFQSPKGTTGR